MVNLWKTGPRNAGVLLTAGAAMALAACGSNPRPQVTAAPPPAPVVRTQTPPAPAPLPPVVDPISALIESSQNAFDSGERELQAGHLERARMAFDQAIQILLDSPYGARTDARLRQHFDRLVDRINAYEVTALAQGDGFVEKSYEAAPIDDLLKNATTFPAPPADASTKATVAEDLQSSAHDIPIPQESKVLSYVEVFRTRLADYMQASLDRGAKYLPMIQSVFRAEGLPLDLAYIPIIESSFKTNALSKAHAKGPWQFMKATAEEHGLKANWFIDERSDPEKATIAAAKYLKTLSGMFDGDWNLVLAAYNGGPGRVQRAMKRSGMNDFWELAASPKYLPKETREYVPMILAAMIIARNPVQYGFEAASAEPIAYEKVSVPHAIDLRRVAEWTGTTVDDIQALNPELRRWTTPVKYPNYEMKVPVGTAGRFEEKLAQASPADFASINWYTVKRGETLLSVARRFHVSKAEVAEANGFTLRARLRPGAEIIIPRAPARLLEARSEHAAPSAVASRSLAHQADSPRIERAVRVADAEPTTAAATTYRVKRGDTLFSIARLFDTSVEKIKSWNRLSSNRITPGARLKILSNRSH